MAIGSSRVLLVDADLRQGVIHEMMGLVAQPGLSELLRQPSELAHLKPVDAIPNLFFIPRGMSLSNPGDLFLSQNLDALLTRCRKEFDYVLIDSSPVFATDDATTLAPKM